ncbi:alpha/beta fold hydrolase [Streptomyces sp. NPDC048001]|uniref:alpha/beta fold hydrolase n=1 Tax=Streptomyces sp. NPDC048001 TaxID=3365498 RepID=UPI0037202B27
MSRVVVCHGIGYQYKHRETWLTEWYDALRVGLTDAALPVPEAGDVSAVYYGSCYRARGGKGNVDNELADIPPLRIGDLNDPLELELLEAFAEGTEVPAAGGKGLGQMALRRLERSERLGQPAGRSVLWMIRQVRRYLDANDTVRACAQQRFERVVTPETRVVIGHSLGSVVGYEALRAHPEWNVHTFVSVGSPLGIRAVYDRLLPSSPAAGDGISSVSRWVNVAAKDDPVALVKHLGPVFGEEVEDRPVVNLPWYNGRKYAFGSHSVLHYLTTAEVAEAVAGGLRAEER